MTSSDYAVHIRDFVRTRFKVQDTDPDFSDDVHLFDYGYVDSFGAVDLTLFVEEKFAVAISESDLLVHRMNTINEIADFVVRRKSGTI